MPFCGYSLGSDFIVVFFIANDGMSGALQHGALGFEDAVFATALLVVVVDDEDGEGLRHGKGLRVSS